MCDVKDGVSFAGSPFEKMVAGTGADPTEDEFHGDAFGDLPCVAEADEQDIAYMVQYGPHYMTQSEAEPKAQDIRQSKVQDTEQSKDMSCLTEKEAQDIPQHKDALLVEHKPQYIIQPKETPSITEHEPHYVEQSKSEPKAQDKGQTKVELETEPKTQNVTRLEGNAATGNKPQDIEVSSGSKPQDIEEIQDAVSILEHMAQDVDEPRDEDTSDKKTLSLDDAFGIITATMTGENAENVDARGAAKQALVKTLRFLGYDEGWLVGSFSLLLDAVDLYGRPSRPKAAAPARRRLRGREKEVPVAPMPEAVPTLAPAPFYAVDPMPEAPKPVPTLAPAPFYAVDPIATMSAGDRLLFNRLRDLRADIANERDVELWMVFNNATLEEMARKRPKTDAEMLAVKGVGEKKLEWYGDDFMAEIKDFEREYGF